MIKSNTNYEEEIFKVIQEIFIGIETRMFSKVKENESFREKLRTKEAMMHGINFLEFYLNQVYKNLVEKDDEFILKKFSQLGELINLHPVYTLNLMSNIIMKFYPMFPRSKLKIDNDIEYIESVINITDSMRKYMMNNFSNELEVLKNQKKNQDCEENDN